MNQILKFGNGMWLKIRYKINVDIKQSNLKIKFTYSEDNLKKINKKENA